MIIDDKKQKFNMSQSHINGMYNVQRQIQEFLNTLFR